MKLSAMLEELGEYIIQTKNKDNSWKSFFRDTRFSAYQTLIAEDLYASLYSYILPRPPSMHADSTQHWHLFNKPNRSTYLSLLINEKCAQSFEDSCTLHWYVLGFSDIRFSNGRMSLGISDMILSERIIKLDLSNGFGGSHLHAMLHRFKQAAERNQIEVDVDLQEYKYETSFQRGRAP